MSTTKLIDASRNILRGITEDSDRVYAAAGRDSRAKQRAADAERDATPEGKAVIAQRKLDAVRIAKEKKQLVKDTAAEITKLLNSYHKSTLRRGLTLEYGKTYGLGPKLRAYKFTQNKPTVREIGGFMTKAAIVYVLGHSKLLEQDKETELAILNHKKLGVSHKTIDIQIVDGTERAWKVIVKPGKGNIHEDVDLDESRDDYRMSFGAPDPLTSREKKAHAKIKKLGKLVVKQIGKSKKMWTLIGAYDIDAYDYREYSQVFERFLDESYQIARDMFDPLTTKRVKGIMGGSYQAVMEARSRGDVGEALQDFAEALTDIQTTIDAWKKELKWIDYIYHFSTWESALGECVNELDDLVNAAE